VRGAGLDHREIGDHGQHQHGNMLDRARPDWSATGRLSESNRRARTLVPLSTSILLSALETTCRRAAPRPAPSPGSASSCAATILEHSAQGMRAPRDAARSVLRQRRDDNRSQPSHRPSLRSIPPPHFSTSRWRQPSSCSIAFSSSLAQFARPRASQVLALHLVRDGDSPSSDNHQAHRARGRKSNPPSLRSISSRPLPSARRRNPSKALSAAR